MSNLLPKLESKTQSVPKLGENKLIRPEVIGMEVKLRMNRFTAENMFKRVKFEDSDFDDRDDKVVIIEVLRPVKEGEESILLHKPTGVQFCVDHYELDGILL